MATSEWLREMRQAAGASHGTTPTATISRPRDTTDALTAPPQAADARDGQTGSPSAEKAQTPPPNAPKRAQRAFTAPTDATRDYRAMYAALFRFHERHNPPTPGDDDGALYWAATSDDMIATARQFNDDPFMIKLLCVVFDELESEYKAMTREAGA